MSDLVVPEQWNWKKFLTGIFEGKNYGKAIILGICQVIIVGLAFSVYLAVSSYLGKRVPSPDNSTITAGQSVTQNIDKSAKEVTQTYLPFSGGLFSFGSHGKTQNKED